MSHVPGQAQTVSGFGNASWAVPNPPSIAYELSFADSTGWEDGIEGRDSETDFADHPDLLKAYLQGKRRGESATYADPF